MEFKATQLFKLSDIYWIFCNNKNLSVLLCGPPFMGAPVRPNMLNMPKSASAAKLNRCRLIRCSSGRIRSQHIQMLSSSHRNFSVTYSCSLNSLQTCWTSLSLSVPWQRIFSVTGEIIVSNVHQLRVLLMLKCCCVCRVGCNRPMQCRPNCNKY